MRAMVLVTASYHLRLDWRAPCLELGWLFTDDEPGIQWSHVQTQSGIAGINASRICEPVKPGREPDLIGAFTRT